MPKNRDAERELGEREAEERRRGADSTPPAHAPERPLDARRGADATPPGHAPERSLDAEPGVEWHAGEDAGEVPAPDEDEGDRAGDEQAPPSPT